MSHDQKRTETCVRVSERGVNMRYNNCEKYCGNCFPLTITVNGCQYVYRYGTKKQRNIGLAQLYYIYGEHITPVYSCAMIAPIRFELERGL